MTNLFITILCYFLLANSLHGAGLKPKYKLKPRGLNKWITSAIAFSPNGELYLLYDRSGKRDPISSKLAVHAYEGTTGTLLRQAEMTTPKIERPRWLQSLEISADGRVVLFVDKPGGGFGPGHRLPDGSRIGIIETEPLALLSTAIISDPPMESSRIIGFTHAGTTVRVAFEQTADDDKHPLGITSRVRLVELDPSDLNRTISERVAENPTTSYGFEVDPWGGFWFYGEVPSPRALLNPSEPLDGQVNVIELENLVGLASVLFLPDAVLGFTKSGGQGVVARYERSLDEGPIAIYSASDCGFGSQATLSSDRKIAAAICSASEMSTFDTLKTTVLRVVVLDTKTLQMLAAIPLAKKPGHDWVTLSHKDGRTLVAILDASQHISVYELGGM